MAVSVAIAAIHPPSLRRERFNAYLLCSIEAPIQSSSR
jgi:hypothetical protein